MNKTPAFWSSCFLSPSSAMRHQSYTYSQEDSVHKVFEKITGLKLQPHHQKIMNGIQRDISLSTNLGLFLAKSFEEFSTCI